LVLALVSVLLLFSLLFGGGGGRAAGGGGGMLSAATDVTIGAKPPVPKRHPVLGLQIVLREYTQHCTNK